MDYGFEQHVNIGSTDAPMEKPLKTIARDKLLLKAEEKFNDITMGGIIVPTMSMRNNRLKEYEVVDIGYTAKEKLKIDKGVRVSADVLARYYDSFPYSVIRWDSIICLRDENHKPHPLPGFAMFEIMKPQDETKGGIIVVTDIQSRMKCIEVNTLGWEEYADVVKPGMTYLQEDVDGDVIQEDTKTYAFFRINAVHYQAEF